ncbi:MAG: FAD-linked oxidase C-terminal domain-containing protein [Gammaproteobacteria bacterium]|nr:FAD-linked oxidase C-terminal domain-containing protein [Gammaproteobacteria bacterium]
MACSLPDNLIDQLRKNFPGNNLLLEAADCWTYGYDNSKIHHPPDAVVLPVNHHQVVSCISLCNQFSIPLTTRGRGTGTTGASVPVSGGIVMSLERMDKILGCDIGNRSVHVQAGVTNLDLQNYLKEKNFFWPPDPSSAEFCTIGGNLACNAAGPRAIKYGTTRDNTLRLKAVTGYGETINTGSKTTKGVVGLDLTRLIIGSEGTLAVITEAELKITPLAPEKNTLRALYKNHQAACDAIQSIGSQLHPPCAIEFMDHHAIDLIRTHSEVSLPSNSRAMLMIEIDGDSESLPISTDKIEQALLNNGLIEIQHAKTGIEKKALWQARKELSPILRNLAPNKINEDVVVPVPNLSKLINALDELSSTFKLPIVNFGHAGNGNLHVNIIYDAEDATQNQNALNCLGKIFEKVLDLDGTISGEHGIGVSKRDHVSKEIGSQELELMRKIKSQFDPNLILNPNKSLPAAKS